MSTRRGPTIVNVPVHNTSIRGTASGLNCCCCRCCTCLQLGFLRSGPGFLKVAEIVLGFFCQSLAVNFGSPYSGTLGLSFQSFMTTGYWCLLTTVLLLICYVFSSRSFGLIKSSVFETLFNGIAAFSYISTCSYLGYAVNMFLPSIVTPYFQAFPAMSATYMLGTILGLIYAYDAYKSYRYFKGYRY